MIEHDCNDMTDPDPIIIRPFQPQDQAACKALVLAGLVEHWLVLDPALNPDLNDIAASFHPGCFLTAWRGLELVGAGGFVPLGGGCAEISRMSVRRDQRGQGLGRRILAALEDEARQRGLRRVVLETTETWHEVVRFYLGAGFQVTHRLDGDVYFAKELSNEM
jgi:putative acetyltransferase